ncbi:MAG: tRNA preQ1(34) S-adenosylmethionine ribosyltransferase-isomerase QueA [Chloroflexi bacterium]|nr:tRNA preQ1(34) S-adenosylmethionine ribosyltransferase-isomerase QueA [Chloroflexota bacterium]
MGGVSPLDLRLSSYDYALPTELIAQSPAEPRDSSRLLVLDRASGMIWHRHVSDLPAFLDTGDLVVANRSRVLPCRLVGSKVGTGGRVELLLLRPITDGVWHALVRGHRVRAGQFVAVGADFAVEVGEPVDGGHLVRFPPESNVVELLHSHGQMPLPPYIHGYTGPPDRYQAVYADTEGSAAAPTAGLHLTPALIATLQAHGVHWTTVILHVGLDTFRPIAEEDVLRHQIHAEWIDVQDELARAVNETRARRRRVLAIGTTTVRALEHVASTGDLRAYRGQADLFVAPGHRFQVVDAMLTNFHMPRSSLLVLVSAFAGRERMLEVYREAIRLRYRFLSFGDAMLIL